MEAIRMEAIVACCGIAAVACSAASDSTAIEGASHEEKSAKLQDGVAAQVGGETIAVERVLVLAHAAQISREDARARLVYDALFAVEAKSRGYEVREDFLKRRRAVLVRVLIERMKAEAYVNPISDKELAEHTGLHWLDMDRPVARRTVHAVVVPSSTEDAWEWARADGVARRIGEAVRGEKDPERFKHAAEAVDGEGMKVIVQDLPPVTADGRVADLDNRPPTGRPTATFDTAFVRAVFALGDVGDHATMVRSSFGTHVIMFVAVQESRELDEGTRREMLAEEIRASRMRGKLADLLSSLHARTPPKVERSAEAMLDLVSDSLTGVAEQVP